MKLGSLGRTGKGKTKKGRTENIKEFDSRGRMEKGRTGTGKRKIG